MSPSYGILLAALGAAPTPGPAPLLQGLVLDAGGRPANGATVSFRLRYADGGGVNGVRPVGPQGEFSVVVHTAPGEAPKGDLVEGDAWAYRGAEVSLLQRVAPGGEPVQIVLQAAARLEVLLDLAPGGRLPGTLLLRGLGPVPMRRGPTVFWSRHVAARRARVDAGAVPAGRVYVDTETEDGAAGCAEVELTPGGSGRLSLRLQRRGSLLLFPHGPGPGPYVISLSPGLGGPDSPAIERNVTEADGVLFEGLLAGVQTATWVDAAGRASTQALTVESGVRWQVDLRDEP